MNENPEEKAKIVIDSDWKEKVAAEREELRRREEAATEQTASAGGKSAGGKSTGGESAKPQASPTGSAEGEERLPPASFSLLVTSLATQAMVALGQIPDPFENKAVVRLPLARHHIDMLGVLEEKTKGNLVPDEQALLTHVLADLRMAYVAMKGK